MVNSTITRQSTQNYVQKKYTVGHAVTHYSCHEKMINSFSFGKEVAWTEGRYKGTGR